MLEPFRFLFSESINIYVQSFGKPLLDDVFLTITALGSQPAYIFLASLIFWCFSKRTGIRAMYVILFSAFAAIFLKNIFNMPRPPPELQKIQENEFGFPSGHAQVASGFWGYVGYKNTHLILPGIAAIFSVSLSRIYLGVHYAGDVAGGIVFGLSVALIFLKTEPFIAKKLEDLSSSTARYIAALMLPAIMIAVAFTQHGLFKEQLGIGFATAGIGAGYVLEEERVRLGDAKSSRQRIIRAAAGTIILGAIYLISTLLLSMSSNFISLQYAAIGFTLTFIAPWVFTKIEP